VSRTDTEGYHEGRTQIGKAIILIVVTAVIAILVLHHVGSSTASTATTASTTTTTVAKGKAKTKKPAASNKPLVPPAQIKLQVLNGLQTGSLAGNLSAVLKTQHGYDTLNANNTTATDSTSMIYVVTHGYYREAEVLAGYVGLTKSSIHRGVPSSAPIPSGVAGQANLVLVIGSSLQARASST
jgi:hypothetical protein